jgi:hypothetical protein
MLQIINIVTLTISTPDLVRSGIVRHVIDKK